MSRWTPEDNLLFSMLQGVPVERAKKKPEELVHIHLM